MHFFASLYPRFAISKVAKSTIILGYLGWQYINFMQCFLRCYSEKFAYLQIL